MKILLHYLDHVFFLMGLIVSHGVRFYVNGINAILCRISRIEKMFSYLRDNCLNKTAFR